MNIGDILFFGDGSVIVRGFLEPDVGYVITCYQDERSFEIGIGGM